MRDNGNGKKEYNDTISPLWEKEYNFTAVVKPETLDALQKVEVGGLLVFKRSKTKNKETSPDAYIEYMSPERLAKIKAQRNTQQEEV